MNLADCFPSEVTPPNIKCGTWLFSNIEKEYGVFAQTGFNEFQYISFNQKGEANRHSSPVKCNDGHNQFTKKEVLEMFSNYWKLENFEVVKRPF